MYLTKSVEFHLWTCPLKNGKITRLAACVPWMSASSSPHTVVYVTPCILKVGRDQSRLDGGILKTIVWRNLPSQELTVDLQKRLTSCLLLVKHNTIFSQGIACKLSLLSTHAMETTSIQWAALPVSRGPWMSTLRSTKSSPTDAV